MTVRTIAATRNLEVLATARLAAMTNVVLADAQIWVLYAKYHYLFWRSVSAIDPTLVTTDGFGRVSTTGIRPRPSSPGGGRC
jgi:predicted lysophospholipase L1 biosynthesis ABC-type transport system permease subunit